MTEPVTTAALLGGAKELAGAAGAKATREALTWRSREQEPRKLLQRVASAVRQDANVPFGIREPLAAALPGKLETQPAAQGAIALLLDGDRVDDASAALADTIARVSEDIVTWPAGFGAEEFGRIVASHACAAVNEVKATDREAAHVDEVQTRDAVESVGASVETVGANVADIQSALARMSGGNPNMDVVAALVAGPIEHAGQTQAVAHANELEHGKDFAAAAEATLEIAAALQDRGLIPVAESYRRRAANLFKTAGDDDRSSALLEDLAWTEIARHSRGATSVISELEQILGNHWLVRGLEACASWPQLPWAEASLDEAIHQDKDSSRRQRWQEMRVLIESVSGDLRRVLEHTAELPPTREGGPRMQLELDRIDALEAVDGSPSADTEWEQLAAWADTLASPAEQATCWQRRASLLAARDDLAGTRVAYRRAMAAWSRAEGTEARAADALFSMQDAEMKLGVWDVDSGSRALAFNLKESSDVPAGGDRLLHSAAASRIAEDFRSAHVDYSHALAMFHAEGDLVGVHVAQNHLGELYRATGRPVAALRVYVSAGNSKRARELAALIEPADAIAALTDMRAPWQRKSAYEALEVLGSTAPTDLVAALSEQLLADATPQPDELPLYTMSEIATRALAAVSLQLPEPVQSPVLTRLYDGVAEPRRIAQAEQCATALIRATQLGLTDSTQTLVDLFLAGSTLNYIPPWWVAQVIARDTGVRIQVAEAARRGSGAAGRALMWAMPEAEEISLWTTVADPLARLFLDVKPVDIREVDGVQQVAYSLGMQFELAGLAMRWATQETRSELFDHLLAIVLQNLAAESARASALNALFNAAESLDAGSIARLRKVLPSLARGEYQHSDIESADIDLLSNIQMRQDTEGMLQAAAIGLLARLDQIDPGSTNNDLASIVANAVDDPRVFVRAAAYGAFTRVDHLDVQIDAAAGLGDPSDLVRPEVVRALFHHDPERLAPLLPPLAFDPSYNARLAVMSAASELRCLEVLIAMSESDPDAYIRGLAAQSLVEREVSTRE